jgi:endonuclease/exonuclease/phosphatase family metal-dependent hydrolase
MEKSFFRRFTKKFFVLCNIILAVLFLLGCYAANFNPQYYWFLGFLTLSSLYLLAGLLFFIIFWLFAKRVFMLVSIAAIAIAWKPIGQLIKFNKGSFTQVKATNNLRVMSWNIEHFDILEHKTHPETKEKMLDLINQYNPDIACFQEMVGGEKDSTAINYVPTIAKKLNYTTYFYAYDKQNDFDSKHSFGTIIFSRYSIINKQILTNGNNNYNAMFQFVDILKNNDTIRVFNVHLQSLKFSEDNLKYIKDAGTNAEISLEKSKSIIAKLKTGFVKRKDQSERIATAISQSPYPVIVCGDFNDVPNSYAYCTIGKGLKNSFAEKGSGIGRTFSGISPTLRIDNIFVDSKFDVEQYIRIPKKLSDHFPIISDVRLTNKDSIK